MVRHQRERVVNDVTAADCAFAEADLERTDPVESGPVAAGCKLVDADGVTYFEHGDQAGANIGVGERDAAFASCGSARPSSSEAVGLLLCRDRREVLSQDTAALLDGMAVLVSQNDADCSGAEVVGKLGQQAVVAVVVHDEVSEAAVERHELLDVVVGRARLAATGEIIWPLRVRRIDIALEWLPCFAVHLGIGLLPPCVEVGECRQEEVIVWPCWLVRTEIDGVGIADSWSGHRRRGGWPARGIVRVAVIFDGGRSRIKRWRSCRSR